MNICRLKIEIKENSEVEKKVIKNFKQCPLKQEET